MKKLTLKGKDVTGVLMVDGKVVALFFGDEVVEVTPDLVRWLATEVTR